MAHYQSPQYAYLIAFGDDGPHVRPVQVTLDPERAKEYATNTRSVVVQVPIWFDGRPARAAQEDAP